MCELNDIYSVFISKLRDCRLVKRDCSIMLFFSIMSLVCSYCFYAVLSSSHTTTEQKHYKGRTVLKDGSCVAEFKTLFISYVLVNLLRIKS
jgi:hypothetical protein